MTLEDSRVRFALLSKQLIKLIYGDLNLIKIMFKESLEVFKTILIMIL